MLQLAVGQAYVLHVHSSRIASPVLTGLSTSTTSTRISATNKIISSTRSSFRTARGGNASVVSCGVAAKVFGTREGELVYNGEDTCTKRQEREEKGKTLADQLRSGGFNEQSRSYSEKLVIRCYEVGMNRTASIETIANLLQEVACNHVQSLGFSSDGFGTTPSMRKQRLIWVATRMHIEVDQYPVWGDVVEVETWCQIEGKIETRRDWLVTNVETGKITARATSTWVMMNQDTRRLARVTEELRADYVMHCPDPPRWACSEDNNHRLKKIPELEGPAQLMRSGLMPRRSDLDMNQHVNNVTYIGWILESMPQDIIDTHQLHRITLDYRRECKHDNVVKSLTSLQLLDNMSNFDNLSSIGTCCNGALVNGTAARHSLGMTREDIQFLHMLRLTGNNVEINRGRTEWRRKAEWPQHGS